MSEQVEQKGLMSTLLEGSVVRMTSFLMASAMSIVILIWPNWIALSPERLSHGTLSLCLGFICLLFVHGVGFRFDSKMVRYLISPFTLWPVTFVLFFSMLGSFGLLKGAA